MRGSAQHLRNPAVAQEVYVRVPAGAAPSALNPLLTVTPMQDALKH